MLSNIHNNHITCSEMHLPTFLDDPTPTPVTTAMEPRLTTAVSDICTTNIIIVIMLLCLRV